MINLFGIETSSLNLSINKLVGTLLFAEFPTTIVYSDNDNNPIIKEWVDCSTDGKIDRFFYYRTSKVYLKKFILGLINHQAFIEHSIDGLLYFQDVDNNNPIRHFIISSGQLNNQYKPNSSYYFIYEDGVDTNEITAFFNLNSVLLTSSALSTTREVSFSKKSEIFNLHIIQGNGIGYGTISTDILGKTLLKFDRLYKNFGFDVLYGKSRGDTFLSQSKKNRFSPEVSTEVVIAEAASYSVFLKPISCQYNVYNSISDSESIAKKLFSLFINSDQLDLLGKEYLLHSDYTINAFREFLKNIYEIQQNIEFVWFDPLSRRNLHQVLNYHQADDILKNIDNLNISSIECFHKKGKFRALNCDTGHFVFATNEDEQYYGYIDKAIREGSETISFRTIYEIQISRQILKEAGRAAAKFSDVITAFYEDSSE
ncbi:MAG: hypothetical protein H6Q15_2524 [Bacteroidetes bacterium]|nr:hypothetical protein [Bacteroidota bacterium]